MEQGLATILQVVIGSGLGAGVVTFVLNFWKAERNIRRANLERLYRALHKYIKEMLFVVLEVRRGEFDATKDRSNIEAQADEIDVLIDLYFPRLKVIFENYRKRNEAFIVNKDTATFRRDQTDFQKDALQIVQASKDFKREVARLMHELEMYPLE
jgi:hypothetical protein